MGRELGEGAYSDFEVTVSGEYSGTVSETYEGTLIVDETRPEMDMMVEKKDGTVYTPDQLTNQPVNVILEGRDELSGIADVRYRINDGEWKTYEGSFWLEQSGEYTIQAETTGRSGNQTVEQLDVWIDTDRPEITIDEELEILLEKGDDYTEPQVSAYDQQDGDITEYIEISGNVDTKKNRDV